MKAILHTGETINESTILGALSCIIWTLTLQTTIKYVCVALRADNNGEGGILALCPAAPTQEQVDVFIGYHWRKHLCWQMESLPQPSRLPQPSKDSKASVPTCRSSLSLLKHIDHLRAALWHRKHRQVVRSLYAACSCCWRDGSLSASRLIH